MLAPTLSWTVSHHECFSIAVKTKKRITRKTVPEGHPGAPENVIPQWSAETIWTVAAQDVSYDISLTKHGRAQC